MSQLQHISEPNPVSITMLNSDGVAVEMVAVNVNGTNLLVPKSQITSLVPTSRSVSTQPETLHNRAYNPHLIAALPIAIGFGLFLFGAVVYAIARPSATPQPVVTPTPAEPRVIVIQQPTPAPAPRTEARDKCILLCF